ncbi:MAG TPA: hypothetical protein VN874_09870 [Myxococcales bacterium]|jgi:hypothetical protein|nr:hypothetical protein [Myxococcales bacterium]
MKSARLVLTLLLGLAALAFAVKHELDGAAGEKAAHTAPRQQLDNVRESAHRIEDDAQRRVDETLRKTEPQ